MGVERPHMVRKTLLINPEKVEKLRKLLKVDSQSEAVRQAIDETLAYSEALAAARRIQSRRQFARP